MHKNTLQHFQGTSAPLACACGCPCVGLALILWLDISTVEYVALDSVVDIIHIGYPVLKALQALCMALYTRSLPTIALECVASVM